MTDDELNVKMAELCKRTLVEGLEGTYVEPLGFAGEETCRTAAGREIVVWNPVGDWQQVHDFVIPAANSHGLDVKMGMLSHWANATSVWKEDKILRSVSEGNDESHCMLTCLAILEAVEKLEASG